MNRQKRLGENTCKPLTKETVYRINKKTLKAQPSENHPFFFNWAKDLTRHLTNTGKYTEKDVQQH